jgi:hypothetical protein
LKVGKAGGEQWKSLSAAVSILMFYTNIGFGELSVLEIKFFDMKTVFCLKATAKYIVV